MEKRINNNISFQKFIKPFLTNKGFIGSNSVTLVENDAVTTDKKTLPSTFNEVQQYCGDKQWQNPQKSFKNVTW